MSTASMQPALHIPQKTERFQNYQLHSAFQPIFSLSHRRAVGYEALIRPYTLTNQSVSPLALFQTLRTASDTLELDACCQRLHVHNFARQAPADRWLFLNIDTATLVHKNYRERFLECAMAEAQLPRHSLVIEILEGAIDDGRVLTEAVDHFRALGAMVAIDDFGAGHSNFDRIWRLAPDIIKLDRSIIEEAGQHGTGKLRRMLPNLVALMHEAGSLVLVEGVETEDQAFIALDADVDFVQGFHFARPSEDIFESACGITQLDGLTQRFTETTIVRDREQKELLAPYIAAFRAAASALEYGQDVHSACQALLGMARTSRCYLLNEIGEQKIHLNAHVQRDVSDKRTSPIVDTRGGTWFRRGYFRSAMSEPRRLHISRPYLSSAGTHMCVTLSISNDHDPRRVLCCDIYW